MTDTHDWREVIEQIGIATYGGKSFEATGMYREKLTTILDAVLLTERKRLVSEVEGMIDFKVAFLTQNEDEEDEFHDIYCRGVKALEMHLKDALQDVIKVIESK